MPVPSLPSRLFSHPRPLSSIPEDPSRCQATFPLLAPASTSSALAARGCCPGRGCALAAGPCWPRCIKLSVRMSLWCRLASLHFEERWATGVSRALCRASPCACCSSPACVHTGAAGGVSGLAARSPILQTYFPRFPFWPFAAFWPERHSSDCDILRWLP